MAPINLGTAVLPDVDAVITEAPAAAAILAGQDVYIDANDGKAKLLSTAIAAATIKLIGVALNSAPTVGQPVKVQYGGRLKGTATVGVGVPYFASDTPGSVGLESDTLSGDHIHFLGVGDTTSSLRLHPFVSGVAKA